MNSLAASSYTYYITDKRLLRRIEVLFLAADLQVTARITRDPIICFYVIFKWCPRLCKLYMYIILDDLSTAAGKTMLNSF